MFKQPQVLKRDRRVTTRLLCKLLPYIYALNDSPHFAPQPLVQAKDVGAPTIEPPMQQNVGCNAPQGGPILLQY
eukprot:4100740-Amphidinium_carterae.2